MASPAATGGRGGRDRGRGRGRFTTNGNARGRGHHLGGDATSPENTPRGRGRAPAQGPLRGDSDTPPRGRRNQNHRGDDRHVASSPRNDYGEDEEEATERKPPLGVRMEYQAVFLEAFNSRPAEKRRFIEAGLMNPDGSIDPKDAVEVQPECEAMCPEYERKLRIYQNTIHKAESHPAPTDQPDSGKRPLRIPDEALMVKEFKRSAAGMDTEFPSDIRTINACGRTVQHLMRLLDRYPMAEIFQFLWDRTRAVRKDLFSQRISERDPAKGLRCYVAIFRFHLHSLHVMPGTMGYDYHQNLEQMEATFKSVFELYAANRRRGNIDADEAEATAYRIILEIGAASVQVAESAIRSIPEDLRSNPQVQTAIELCRAGHAAMAGTVRKSIIEKFWALVSAPQVTYLMACAAERCFNDVRPNILKFIMLKFQKNRPGQGNLKPSPLTPSWVAENLRFEDEGQVRHFVDQYGCKFVRNDEGMELLEFPEAGLPTFKDPVPQYKSSIVDGKLSPNDSVVDMLIGEGFDVFGEESDSLFVPEHPNTGLDASLNAQSAKNTGGTINARATLGIFGATADRSTTSTTLFAPSPFTVNGSGLPPPPGPFAVAAMASQGTANAARPNFLPISAGSQPQYGTPSPNHTYGPFGHLASGPSQPNPFIQSNPFSQPTNGPVSQPASGPFRQPTNGPFSQPASGPFSQPTNSPFSQPASGPFSQPTNGVFQTPPASSSPDQDASVQEEAEKAARDQKEQRERHLAEQAAKEAEERRHREAFLENQRRAAESEAARQAEADAARQAEVEAARRAQFEAAQKEQREAARLAQIEADRIAAVNALKDRSYDALATSLVLDSGRGILAEFIEDLAGKLVIEVRKEEAYRQKLKDQQEADAYRVWKLQCKYFVRWALIVQKRIRKARDRVQYLARVQWRAEYAAQKKKDAMRKKSKTHKSSRPRVTSKPPDAAVPAPTETPRALATPQSRTNTYEARIASAPPYRNPNMSIDRTETDYFELKARGLDPQKHKRSYHVFANDETDTVDEEAESKRPRAPSTPVPQFVSSTSSVTSSVAKKASPVLAEHTTRRATVLERAGKLLQQHPVKIEDPKVSLPPSQPVNRPAYWSRTSNFVPRDLYGQGPAAVAQYFHDGSQADGAEKESVSFSSPMSTQQYSVPMTQDMGMDDFIESNTTSDGFMSGNGFTEGEASEEYSEASDDIEVEQYAQQLGNTQDDAIELSD